MPTTNLGILAHVDAGKTTLTERLLYAAGVIDRPGSVDAGTTQTDTLALERRRGITIRSAVASFTIGDVTVNLVDTPGHPDFVAEVERALRVLDGAVLVVCAVEGVQPQTRILLRVLRRSRVPTLLFVNKIDRRGAGYADVLAAIRERLTDAVVPMGAVSELGTPRAAFTAFGAADPDFRSRLIDVLADRDDALLAAYVVDESTVTYPRLRAALAEQTRRVAVHPVLFGSARTGAGVDALRAAIVELLPVADGDPDGPVSGRVFKIERGAAKEKIAYVRMSSGTIRARDRVRFGATGEAKLTAVEVVGPVPTEGAADLAAGRIGRVWGLRDVRIGDEIGGSGSPPTRHDFAPPTVETVIVPRRPGDKPALRDALAQLAEQDPLIDFRQDENQRLSVSLYGEVQREVLEATLADEYAVEVDFREATVICVERPVRAGEAREVLNTRSNPFHTTLGLRIAPAPAGTGVDFRLRIDPQTAPLFLFRNIDGFAAAMDRHVRRTLHEGLFGWPVTDCVVTLVECGYSLADGPPSKRGPMPTHADVRNLVPLVVMAAVRRAGTVVCEPYLTVSVEVPSNAANAALRGITRLGATVDGQFPAGRMTTIHTRLPAARLATLRRQLPRLSNGEGAIEADFAGYQPVAGRPPTRARTTVNPLSRAEYMASLARQGATP